MPEVKLKGVVESLDSVPESHRSLYTKQGDGFVLTEVTLEDTTGLKSTVTATRTERDAARAEAKAFKDAGVSIEEWNEYKASKETADADKHKKAGDWEANEKRLNTTHTNALKAKDDEIARRQKALENEMIDSRARAALAAAGGNQLFLLPHVTPSIAIKEENGTFVARVVDATGAVRVNSAGNPMSIDERIAELKADTQFAGAFAASGSGGTGSPAGGAGGGKPGAGNQKTIKRADFDKLDGHAKSNAILKDKLVVVD